MVSHKKGEAVNRSGGLHLCWPYNSVGGGGGGGGVETLGELL